MQVSLLAPVHLEELVVRLGVALLAGGIIGLERQLKGKAAGLRTYMLVSLGSAFFVLVPIQLGVVQQSADAFSRVLQGIIAGIGFVGGGVILHRSNERSNRVVVRGITSAAAIWIASAIGTAAGSGLWELSLIGAVVSLFVLRILKQVED